MVDEGDVAVGLRDRRSDPARVHGMGIQILEPRRHGAAQAGGEVARRLVDEVRGAGRDRDDIGAQLTDVRHPGCELGADGVGIIPVVEREDGHTVARVEEVPEHRVRRKRPAARRRVGNAPAHHQRDVHLRP